MNAAQNYISGGPTTLKDLHHEGQGLWSSVQMPSFTKVVLLLELWVPSSLHCWEISFQAYFPPEALSVVFSSIFAERKVRGDAFMAL